jgi:predicted esterase YcpF (UPF0227 family)
MPTIDYSAKESIPSIICLHGGGPSSKNSTAYLSKELVSIGRSVVRLDFSGHGESTGDIKNSSLAKRYFEACTIIDEFKLEKDIIVIGTSMGGYIASKIASTHDVNKLILFGPATYSQKAYELKFGNGFTQEIRREKSYMDTDLDVMLKDFTGDSYLIYGDQENIIPQDVLSMYRDLLQKSGQFKEMIIQDCPHPVHRWIKKQRATKEILLKEIVDFIQN